MQDDLVKLTVRSGDIAHSFTIDEYHALRSASPRESSTTLRVPGGSAPAPSAFYCALTSEAGHRMMHGELVVRAR